MADGSVARVLDYGTQCLAVTAAGVQKLRHDPLELVTRAARPVLWLMLFGEVMARVHGISPGRIRYLDFLASGTRPRRASALSRQSGTPIGAGDRKGSVGKRAGLVASTDRLPARPRPAHAADRLR
jgi:hypothetical protein